MSPVQITFDLTEDDLLALQTQTLARRRDRVYRSKLVFLSGGIVAGLVCWPLWRYGVGSVFGTGATRIGVYVIVILLAGAIAAFLRPRLPRPRFGRLYAWSARRLARAAAKRSTLGRVTLTIADDALVRVNADGERRIPWSRMRAILVSPDLVTVWLRGENRALVVPGRAFPDEAAAAEFQALIEKRAGLPSISVPEV